MTDPNYRDILDAIFKAHRLVLCVDLHHAATLGAANKLAYFVAHLQ